MPKIEEKISTTAKRTYKKLEEVYGEDVVIEGLLKDYKKFETAEAENEVLKKELEVLKKVAKKEVPARAETSSPSPTPDIIAVLNNTIEVYARENDRLLKIVNFSEYDEKINGLKAEIEKHQSSSEKLSEALKAEKKRAVDLGYDKRKIEETVEELTTELKAEKKEVNNLETKVSGLEADKAQRDTTITSYAAELERSKATVEELKGQIPIPHEPDVEAPAYS